MPITTNPFSARKAGPYMASAGQTVFSFGFPVLAAGDLTVWRDRADVVTQLLLDSHYTVSGAGEQTGGTVVLTAGALESDIIAIDGTLDQERATSFIGGVPFKTVHIDSDLNRFAIMVQELNRESDRAIRRSPLDPVTGSLFLPRDVSETTLLALSAAGDVVGLLPVNLNIGAVTPLAANLLNDTTPADARATLGAASADDILSIKGAFGAVGDGVTDDTAAVTAADADPKAKFVPAGVYDTTISQAALRGPYWGRGQLRDSGSNLRAPWFSAIDAAPATLGDHDSILTAFNGDLSKVQIAMEHRITGAATLGQPITGYQSDPEASPIYINMFNSSGHNESLSGNDGRTAAAAIRIQLGQAGQGDMMGLYINGVVASTRAGATNFLANPAVSLFAGALFAGIDGAFLNPAETQMRDNGFDCAALGWNMVLERTNGTGAKDAFWRGFRVHSSGSQAADVAYGLAGLFKYGVDLVHGTYTGNAALALKANDRIYGNSVADLTGISRFPSSPGDDWIEFNSGINAWSFVNGNSSIFQIYNNQIVSVQPAFLLDNVVITHTASLAIAPGIEPILQVHGTTGATSGIGNARYSNGVTGPSNYLSKSRGTTVGSHVIVQLNDTLGLQQFSGSDGVGFINGALIEARVTGTPGVNDMPTSLLFHVTPDGGAAAVEAYRLTHNRLPIWSTNSATPETLATNGQITMTATANNNLRFSHRGTDGTTRVGLPRIAIPVSKLEPGAQPPAFELDEA